IAAASTTTSPTTPAPIIHGGIGFAGRGGSVSSTGIWSAGMSTSCGVSRGTDIRPSVSVGGCNGAGVAGTEAEPFADVADAADVPPPIEATNGRSTRVSPNEYDSAPAL